MKSVQTRSFFCSVFFRIRTEYGEILRISPYYVRMRENTDQKKNRIWTHFTQCRLLWFSLSESFLSLYLWSLEESFIQSRASTSTHALSLIILLPSSPTLGITYFRLFLSTLFIWTNKCRCNVQNRNLNVGCFFKENMQKSSLKNIFNILTRWRHK